MLPRKRPLGAESEDRAAAGDESNQKRKTDHLISSSAAASSAAEGGYVMDPEANGSSKGAAGSPSEIDEDLHSRQLAVYGRETMRRLFASNVLVSGLNGLGAEIAKNLVLAGVKSVTLHDEGNVELWDLSSNFFFTEEDVGSNRALACLQKLQELNNAVMVLTLTENLTKEHLSRFQKVANLPSFVL